LPEFVKGNRADFIPKFIPSAIWDKNHKNHEGHEGHTKDTKDNFLSLCVLREHFVPLWLKQTLTHIPGGASDGPATQR
jgi:hypothetical protein